MYVIGQFWRLAEYMYSKFSDLGRSRSREQLLIDVVLLTCCYYEHILSTEGRWTFVTVSRCFPQPFVYGIQNPRRLHCSPETGFGSVTSHFKLVCSRSFLSSDRFRVSRSAMSSALSRSWTFAIQNVLKLKYALYNLVHWRQKQIWGKFIALSFSTLRAKRIRSYTVTLGTSASYIRWRFTNSEFMF